ncbi:signal peptidase I [Arthrobacter glacialis]|uniref:Signal peptidase I n=1 Tax=Arthrobacter glacialis TaxID=1664 RepID=A0A2S3ZSM0_ARTGL|nr:signal peptidase I [Arthrobacter glacialis]POH72173.1 signal peptidase I [Arthrobacter glacialis]
MKIKRSLGLLSDSNKDARSTEGVNIEPVHPIRKAIISGIKEIAIIIVIAVLLSLIIKTFLFRAFYIPSGSMEETLQVGDRVFVNLLVPEPISLKRGDVVVFKDSQGWLGNNVPKPAPVEQLFINFGLAPDSSSEHLIKRVIGLPGDHIVCCDSQGKISVNDKSINEPYLAPGSTNDYGPSSSKFDLIVPEGKIWVMGDNRNNSSDSRFHQELNGKGFVPISDVVGSAFVIAWPISNWGILGNYPDTFSGIDH